MERKQISANFLVRTAIIAALYAALTLVNPFSYLGVQFRLSEVLVLLIFVDRKYFLGIVLGTFIANLPSPLGFVDVLFGTTATVLTGLLIQRTQSITLASFWPALVNAPIIGFLLYEVLGLPFWLSTLQVFLGQFVVVTLFGSLVFRRILRDARLMELLRF